MGSPPVISADQSAIQEILASVCICTYQRPGVVDTVRSIFSQIGVVPEIEVVVCDDDESGSARQWVAPLLENAPFAVKYVLCASKNISICRNTCIAEARGEWIVFIDDDEIAEANWLHELLSTQAEYNADVIKGYVRGIYPTGTPHWILEGDPFTRDHGPSGTRLTRFGTGNVMFRRSLVIDGNIWFDESLGRTGGEDYDFFGRLSERGIYMVASQTAIVNEVTPFSRVQKGYLRRRYRRQGQVDAKYYRVRSSLIRQFKVLVRCTISVSKFAPYPFMRLISDKRSFEMFRRFWHSFGMLEYTLGRQPIVTD
jgi:succinoglycan biosynthesis protein ExoM